MSAEAGGLVLLTGHGNGLASRVCEKEQCSEKRCPRVRWARGHPWFCFWL